MRIGIGIDTGGTCTDAVIYRREDKTILASGKAPTTKENLSVGIGAALDQLPKELVAEAVIIALSTTLATNACVENKGGRAKLIFFGVQKENVQRVGKEYGLTVDETLLFVPSRTRPNGEITEPPNWEAFTRSLTEFLSDAAAVGLVELYAHKTGGVLERHAAELIRREKEIPVVCGHHLVSESNIIRRGATALLNARLLSVIEEFLKAVETALRARGITAPVVMVRSDGSLMNTAFTASHPVETLLSGPVASVMGAVTLADERDALIVDMGGTTTDIAFVKNTVPQRVSTGIRIGSWNTFVKGLFVDTFGLGGDSGVSVTADKQLRLEEEKTMPLCMAAAKYPSLLKLLRREEQSGSRLISRQKDIYLCLKEKLDSNGYTERERHIAAALNEPKSLEQLKEELGEVIMEQHLSRLLREGVLIRCAVTPTDAMHFKGEFTAYDMEASQLGLSIMARQLHISAEELAERIYDAVRQKLYFGIVRVLLEDSYPAVRESGLVGAMETVIHESYIAAKRGEKRVFLGIDIRCAATLIGVGAPIARFLPEVGRLLGAEVKISPYSPVANALGAVVGEIRAEAELRVEYRQEQDDYLVFGAGERQECKTLAEAKTLAASLANRKAREDAILRGGAEETLRFTLDEEEQIVDTEFGPVYMGYRVTVTALGELRLTEER